MPQPDENVFFGGYTQRYSEVLRSGTKPSGASRQEERKNGEDNDSPKGVQDFLEGVDHMRSGALTGREVRRTSDIDFDHKVSSFLRRPSEKQQSLLNLS